MRVTGQSPGNRARIQNPESRVLATHCPPPPQSLCDPEEPWQPSSPPLCSSHTRALYILIALFLLPMGHVWGGNNGFQSPIRFFHVWTAVCGYRIPLRGKLEAPVGLCPCFCSWGRCTLPAVRPSRLHGPPRWPFSSTLACSHPGQGTRDLSSSAGLLQVETFSLGSPRPAPPPPRHGSPSAGRPSYWLGQRIHSGFSILFVQPSA